MINGRKHAAVGMVTTAAESYALYLQLEQTAWEMRAELQRRQEFRTGAVYFFGGLVMMWCHRRGRRR
jgi:hypothetical protein